MVHADSVVLAWRNLDLLDDLVRRALSDRLTETVGCSLVEHDLLAWLTVAPECRLRMLDLANRLSVTKGGLTRIVDRLVERGWLERDRPESNRREVYAALTDEGRRVMATARTAYLDVLTETLGNRLTQDELNTLSRITGNLLNTMAEHHSCPAPSSPPDK